MERIRQQANNITNIVYIISAPIYFGLFYTVPYAHEWAVFIAIFGFSWTLVPTIFLITYHYFIWKRTNKDLYMEGLWDFTEKQFYLNASTGEKNFNFDAFGVMEISQSVKSIEIKIGKTYRLLDSNKSLPLHISTWWSITCELHETYPHLIAALDHEAPEEPGNESTKYGVEVFKIIDRDKNKMPIFMKSEVHHFWRNGQQRIVYVDYKRRGYNSKHKLQNSENIDFTEL